MFNILISKTRPIAITKRLLQTSGLRVQSTNFQRIPKKTFAVATSIGIFCCLKPSKIVFCKMSSNVEYLLQNSDQLFDENKYQEALDVLNNFEDQSSSDIKWRQARAMFKLSKTDKNKKNELIRNGYELVKEAVHTNDRDFAAHKWMAILLDAKSELDGIKERVSQLENVKKHMEAAIELNPEDPTSWHLLGNFAFGLADMPWYQRKIVSAFFATPPSGTYEEALEHFLKAEEKKPNFYSMNLLLIGKCYQRLKNDEKAKHYLTLASNINVLNEDDKICKEEATGLLKKY